MKGTTTSDDSVILTRREIERARSGGKERVVHKGVIGKGNLTPLNFTYKLP